MGVRRGGEREGRADAHAQRTGVDGAEEIVGAASAKPAVMSKLPWPMNPASARARRALIGGVLGAVWGTLSCATSASKSCRRSPDISLALPSETIRDS